MGKQEVKKTQKFKYKAEMKQLLHLIIHSLYTHPEVFLRELISNSSDALNKVRFNKLTDTSIIDAGAELKITLSLDKEKNTFSIEDTGIGMDKDDLIKQIGTIAKSGTLEFVKQMQEAKKKPDGDMIGKFGVGFYSVFMVTDEITVETRKADKDSIGYKWVSNGEDNFTIEEVDLKNRGTKISFTLKEEFKEFAEDWRVKSVLNKYSNFVDFPIYMDEEKINNVTAIWQKKQTDVKDEEREEFYKFISSDFNKHLDYIHLNIEGNLNFKALLFFPENAPPNLFALENDKSLHLYSNKVFIQDNAKDLLPDYLKFVKGVVDTDDLPLNVSREVTQNSPVMPKIKNVITGKILTEFEKWASKDREKYVKFFKEFGVLIKTGLNSDFMNKDRLTKLILFESTKSKNDEYTFLSEYVERMKKEQKEIYYITGEHKKLVENSPKLEYFKKNDLEVLILTDPVDSFIIPQLQEFDGKKVVSIDKAEIKENKDVKKDSLEKENADSLLKEFKSILGDRVEDVVESKRLVDSAVTLVSGQMGMDAQMERMMQMMDKNFQTPKKVLEINISHPLIKKLSEIFIKDGSNLTLRDNVNQLFDGALLLDGNLQYPDSFINRMTEFMEKAMKS